MIVNWVMNCACCVMQCSVISPRFDVKMKDLEHWTAYLLPSRQFGYAPTCSSITDVDSSKIKSYGCVENDSSVINMF